MAKTITKNNYQAVLTGATGGIGQALAQSLAPQCTSLILLGRDLQKLQALQASLSQSGAQIKILAGDLTQEQTLSELKALVQSTGGIDLLINNAGTSQFKSFTEQTSPELEGLLKTNLIAPMLLTQTLVPELMKANSAQIINIGSIFGYIGFPGFASYCASKFGLRGFSQSLRRELADTSIRVKYFAPRATKTSINSDAVMQMNVELKTESDSPAWVASEFMKFLESSAWEKKLGGKESFFVFMNQLFPSVPDKAILGQLPIIKKYLKR
jgi:short-subunit dehydrogenase